MKSGEILECHLATFSLSFPLCPLFQSGKSDLVIHHGTETAGGRNPQNPAPQQRLHAHVIWFLVSCATFEPNLLNTALNTGPYAASSFIVRYNVNF